MRLTCQEFPSSERFVYATANAGANVNRRKGKLWKAFRHNYLQLDETTEQEVLVEERYAYKGRGGRVSNKNIYLDGETSPRFTQAFTWTELGRPESLTYPSCTG